MCVFKSFLVVCVTHRQPPASLQAVNTVELEQLSARFNSGGNGGGDGGGIAHAGTRKQTHRRTTQRGGGVGGRDGVYGEGLKKRSCLNCLVLTKQKKGK